MRIFLWIGVLAILLFSGCLQFQNQFTALAPGKWRVVLQLTPQVQFTNPKGEPLDELMGLEFEEVSEGELPFIMEVIYTDPENFVIEIINGEERIRVEDIRVGRDRATAKDTLKIDFPVFDTRIEAIYEEKVMAGEWIVNYKEGYRIPFVARQGKDHRFTTLRKDPIMDVSGRWEVTFGLDTDEPYPAIGEFKQEGNHLTGTFATETGDYRYLEGSVQEDKLYLSTFDGSHAFLFEAKIKADSTLTGSFRSGKHYKTTWEARPNPDVSLTPPDSLSKIVHPEKIGSSRFTDLNGRKISFSDPQFSGQPKLIMLMGTWCPNCRDATRFLTNYLENNETGNLAVFGLAFEKYRSEEKALSALRVYREKMQIEYPLLLGGYADKKEAAEKIAILDKLTSYPTFLLVDDKNTVRKVYSGFYGPATREYQAFQKDFDQMIKDLLAK
jgi:thiol-disulfide isomerase/thioredoxin